MKCLVLILAFFHSLLLCIGGVINEEKDNYYNIYNDNRDNDNHAL